MSIHSSTAVPSMSGSPTRVGRKFLVATAGSVVLAAAVVAAFAAWNAGGSSSAVSNPNLVVPAAVASQPSVNRGLEEPVMKTYIVESEQLAQAIRDYDQMVTSGVAGMDASTNVQVDVEVATDDAGAAAIVQGINEANNIRRTLGLTEIQVVDLRSN